MNLRKFVWFGVLMISGTSVAKADSACDILKAVIGNGVAINSKPPKATSEAMAWPNADNTFIGGGGYTAHLYQGSPSQGDVAKMNRAIDAADKIVSECLPSARRIVHGTVGADKEVLFCIPGNSRTVSIQSSMGNRMVSAFLTVSVAHTTNCPR